SASLLHGACHPKYQLSPALISGTPACSICISVPADTAFSVTVTVISPGRFPSSNESVYTNRSPGTSSTYVPPNEWLSPVVKFRKDILCLPPTFASSSWTEQTKP